MSEPLLTISNHHTAHCGDPPILTDDADVYVGYFENVYGEQWLFTFDHNTHKAELRGGDVGWNTVHEVHSGRAVGLIMSIDEQLWLQACWEAACARAA